MISIISNPNDISDGIKINGEMIFNSPWKRFGKYNHYLIIDEQNNIEIIKGHAGELVPGSTEDLIEFYNKMNWETGIPNVPMTLELDPTYQCLSKNCGEHCFSYQYRKLNPNANISSINMKSIICHFANNGGRIVRFDGGGEPFLHPNIANGSLVKLSADLHLKSTVLTSGDSFVSSKININLFAESNCYLRFSLNAASDETREKMHGNTISLFGIFNAIEQYSKLLSINKNETPIGATFLLSHLNFLELFKCAEMSKNIGINHFSVRRVLGPPVIRPNFNKKERDKIKAQFNRIKELEDDNFIVFLPWREINEPDLDTSDFHVERCWQSTAKTIIEPDTINPKKAKIQLCGRCRGNQNNSTLPPLAQDIGEGNWVHLWKNSFYKYTYSRKELLNICHSCIDFGFIKMFDELTKYRNKDVKLVHLKIKQ